VAGKNEPVRQLRVFGSGFFDHDFFGSGLGAEHRSKNAGIKVSYDRSSIEAVVEDYFADLP